MSVGVGVVWCSTVGSGSLSGFDDTFPFGIADGEFIGVAVGDTTGGESVIIGVCDGNGTVAVAAGVFVGFTVTVGVFVGAGVITGDTVGISVGVGDADGCSSSAGCTGSFVSSSAGLS